MKYFVTTIFLLHFITESFSQYNKISELGRNITNTIKDPSGTGDELIGNIYQYFEALREIYNEMKQGAEEGMEDFKKLQDSGGPPFLNLLPIDETPLREFYKWTAYQGIEFRGFLKYTEDEWANMKELASKNKSEKN